MCKSIKNVLMQAILHLLMVYGLLFPSSSSASQRNMRSVDSIANIIMNRQGLLFGSTKHHQIKPVMKFRSSELGVKAKQLLGKNEAFYVYDDVNGNDGFVIVSADDRLPEVLAYSYDETFSLKSMPACTRYWLECYLDEYMSLETPVEVSEASEIQTAEVHPEGVEPLLGKLPWGQSDPFNGLCPMSEGGRCVTGCVATAMSQIMWLHQWPECGKGNISYSTRTHKINVRMNLAEHPLHWSLIKAEYNRGKYTEDEANAVATLMATCGASVHMDYGVDGSGAYQEDILRALVSNFYYDADAAFLSRKDFSSADWHSLLITELNEGRAVNYAGQSRTDGGHSFVIDGYEAGSNGSNPYYHLNWGWNGRCNGYYTLPRLLPTENGNNYVKDSFSDGQQMLIGVRPNNGIVEANKMLCAKELRVMQAKLRPGEATTLKVNEITNLCYRTFRGKLAVQIRNEDGKSFIVGSTRNEPIPYLESIYSLTIPFVIPESFEDGIYSVRIVGVSEDGKQTVMYSRSVPQIMVSKKPYGEETPTELTLLCSSEFEVFKTADSDSLINVRVYELFNYSDELLEGDLQLEIATDDGNFVMNIGTSVWHPAFESQEVEPAPIALFGAIPDTLSSGHYRLYATFYPSEQYIAFANRIKFYDRVDPTEVPTEYFLPMEVLENEILINGVSFSKTTTGIKSVSIQKDSSSRIYSIMGIRRFKKMKGISIVRKYDGSFYKVMVK